jgi:hypothetical protein
VGIIFTIPAPAVEWAKMPNPYGHLKNFYLATYYIDKAEAARIAMKPVILESVLDSQCDSRSDSIAAERDGIESSCSPWAQLYS